MKIETENEKKLLDEVKKIMRSLLISTKHGLTLNELSSEYELITCKALPLRELGFSSVVDLVRAMPDVVRPTFKSGAAMLLRGVADESTAHIKDLVQGQRSSGRRRNTKISAPKQVSVKKYKKTVPSFISSKIHNLIKYYPYGLEFRMFENAYLNQYGRRLNPQLQGFTSVSGLLEACTDVIRMEFKSDSRTSGVLMLHPINKIEVPQRVSSKAAPLLPLAVKYLEEHKVLNHPNVTKPKKKIPEDMKKCIHTVLLKRRNGMFSARFPFEYKAHYGCEFELQKLGFGSIVELMSELPELVDITRPTEKGDWLLLPKISDVDTVKTVVDYSTVPAGEVNANIDICVSYIVDPSLFWVQISSSLCQLHELMDDMTKFYDVDTELKYQLPEASIVPGQPCAALYDDEQWYRAVIREVLPDDGAVNVYYVDYGNECDIDATCLSILKEEYMKLPCQAFKAKLNGVVPEGVSSEDTWSKEEIETFYELTCDLQLHAKIIEKEPNLSLALFDLDNNDVASTLNSRIADKRRDEASKREKQESTGKSENNVETKCERMLSDLHDQSISEEQKVPHTSTYDDLVKCVTVSEDYKLHVLQYEGSAYVLSVEISGLFWEADILRQMLHQKGAVIESKYLLARDNEHLFTALQKYHISGTANGKITKNILSVYQLTVIPKIHSFFKDVCKHTNIIAVILNELRLWSNTTHVAQYWNPFTSASNYDGLSQETILTLHALMFKRKRLYYMIFLNEHTAEESDR